jgi:hypothetical protein
MSKPTQKLLPFDDAPVPPAPPAPPAVKPHRYEPSDEALEAFEQLEDWQLDARGRPVDARAEETLRCLARALLDGKNGYWHAAEDRLQAMLADPPLCVQAGDAKAFADTIDELLDHLHDSLSVGRSR